MKEILARVFLFVILACGTLIVAITQQAWLVSLIVFGLILFWLIHPSSHYFQICVMLALIPMFVIFNFFASNMDNRYWSLRMFNSLHGVSSCSSDSHSHQVVYNPNGFNAVVDPSEAVTYCHYDGVRWADNSGVRFNGYLDVGSLFTSEPCDGCVYASTKKEDYDMNLGKGLSHGYYLGASVEDTVLCRGVEYVRSESGVMGRGKQICAVCTVNSFRKGLIDKTYGCREYENSDAMCVFCPGHVMFHIDSGDEMRFVVGWILFWMIVICLAMCLWRPCFEKREKKSAKVWVDVHNSKVKENQ